MLLMYSINDVVSIILTHYSFLCCWVAFIFASPKHIIVSLIKDFTIFYYDHLFKLFKKETHSGQFTWQVNEPLPGLTHAL